VLSRLPIDVLKIDRSFVRDIGSNRSDRLIVQSTIALARSLGMRTVAEGVETEEQASLLVDLGCDMLQGFHIKRPVSGSDIGEWLSSGTDVADIGAGAAG
jgi:EAL domain-containing protein (putative c-di-GMP-specific phosphodiesterase class I)